MRAPHKCGGWELGSEGAGTFDTVSTKAEFCLSQCAAPSDQEASCPSHGNKHALVRCLAEGELVGCGLGLGFCGICPSVRIHDLQLS